MIETVSTREAPDVAAFIERVVATSVDATDAEKAAFLENIRANLAMWQEAPEAALHLKFTIGGVLAGVVMVKAFWNLCHLFVEPRQQKQGVGRALLEAAIAGCKDKSSRQYLRLNSSRNAITFYEHMGFVPVRDAPAPFTGVQYEFKL